VVVESYVLHIYRREKQSDVQHARRLTDQYQLIGVLEESVSEVRRPFHSLEELWNLLISKENYKSIE